MDKVVFVLVLLLSQSAMSQQLSLPQKCKSAARDSAIFEDAEVTYGCNLKSMNLATQMYATKINKFRRDFCGSTPQEELLANKAEAVLDNREQYQLTESIQGRQKAQGVFCHGLNAYSIRTSIFPD
jgi:hypothetical protein